MSSLGKNEVFSILLVLKSDARVAHVLEHPEMAGLERALEETLAAPEAIVASFTDPQARPYSRFYTGTRVGDNYLCVVVRIDVDDPFVLPAYLTAKIKSRVRIWPEEG